MVEIVETMEAFSSLADVWHSLQEDSKVRIFQTFEWCWHGWSLTLEGDGNARLWIVKWTREGTDDVVILPTYIDGRGVLRFINDRHSDVGDAVYKRVNVNRHYAYKEIADTILSESRIVRVELHKLRSDSEALDHLGVFLRGAVVYRDNAYSHLFIPAGCPFIDGQAQLKQRDRQRMKRIARQSGFDEFCICSAMHGDPFPVEKIKCLRDYMAAHGRNGTAFFSDAMIDFIRKVYDCGLCEIPLCEDKNGPAILAFRLLKGTVVTCWVVLYRETAYNTELHLKYLQEKNGLPSFVYDFGVGAYGYKLGTFRPSLGVNFALEYGKGWGAHLISLCHMTVRALKDFIKARRS